MTKKIAGEKILAKIKNNEFTRSQLVRIRHNILGKHNQDEAQEVLDLIDLSKPIDKYILFMGFCPNANFNNRLDIEWKEKGICRFDWEESKRQMNKFYEICAGDLVVLKIQNRHTQTMKLHGFGRVKQVAYDENDVRYLVMNWDKQDEIIEIPLMGCSSTVNIRQMENVKKQMSQEFFDWLKN